MKDKAPHSMTHKEILNAKFERALENYLDSIVAIEKKEPHSSLHSFASAKQEIRDKISTAARLFQKGYLNGYLSLVEELKQEMDSSESKENLLALVEVSPEKLKIFKDPVVLMKALEEGNSIYELLNFSEKTLNVFYTAACHLIDKKEFQKARDAFHFLVTIAPEVYEFWIKLGQCYISLAEYEAALQLFFQTIDIDPTKIAAYVQAIHLFIQLHDFNNASAVCNAGLLLAQEHQEKAWAISLRLAMEKEMDSFTSGFHK